jgi:hypothetical protein
LTGGGNLSADLTLGLSSPLPVANGGTGSTSQNFVDLTTTQASIAGQKTLKGNNVTDTTQLGTILQNGNGAAYMEGIVGVGDPAGTLGPAGARCLQIFDGAAANPVTDPGFGTSDATRPTTLFQRTTASTATSEISYATTTKIIGGSGERYGHFNALHTIAGKTTLVGGINNVVTSLTTASSAGFPAAPFKALIGTEIMLVSVAVGTAWSSITRGVDGTTAAAHLNGDVISQVVVGDVNALVSSAYFENPCGAGFTNYAMWPRIERTVVTRLCGMELDVFNTTTTDAAPTAADSTNSTIGLAITCGGTARNSVGLSFQNGVGAATAYATGIDFGSNTAYNYAIDCNSLTAIPPLRMANNTSIVGRNAANASDKAMLQLNGSDQVMLDPAGTQGVSVGGPLIFPHGSVTLVNGLNSNINIGNATFIRFSGPSGAYSVGGFTGGVDGRILYAFMLDAQQATIVNADASSSVGNKITTGTGANVTPRLGIHFETYIYDGPLTAWLLIANN